MTDVILLAKDNEELRRYVNNIRNQSHCWGSCFEGKSDCVATVSVIGGLSKAFYTWSMTTYDGLKGRLERMVQDERVKSIALFIDSPGGEAMGLLDCCDYIREVSKKKPVHALIDGLGCSAAYAIASACTDITITPESRTGCCGAILSYEETTEDWYKKAGLIHRIFRSKVSPKKNLSILDNGVEEKIQKEVDAMGESYLRKVASMRGISYEKALETFGQGETVTPEYALANGMVDRISTIEEFANYIIGSPDNQEGGGENDMEIKSMSAQDIYALLSDEQKEGLGSLCAVSVPSEREAEIRMEERTRLQGLNALRNGSEEIDRIVDLAVADGRDAKDISLEIINLYKAQSPANQQNANGNNGKTVLNSLLENTNEVNVPQSAEMSEDEAIKCLFGL